MKLSIFSQQYKIMVVGLLLLLFLILQGCGSGRKGITVDSVPQGADILADGKNIGKTPMVIKQDDVFPPHWYGRSYMVKGQLELQKEGCDGIRMDVNDLVLSKDIKKNLSCKPESKQKAPVAKVPARHPPEDEVPMMKDAETKTKTKTKTKTVESQPAAKPSKLDDEIEGRLTRLESLRDRGVITKKEYVEQRKRILDSL